MSLVGKLGFVWIVIDSLLPLLACCFFSAFASDSNRSPFCISTNLEAGDLRLSAVAAHNERKEERKKNKFFNSFSFFRQKRVHNRSFLGYQKEEREGWISLISYQAKCSKKWFFGSLFYQLKTCETASSLQGSRAIHLDVFEIQISDSRPMAYRHTAYRRW